MRNNDSSEHHQNNNLKVVIAFGNFIGKDISFLDVNKKGNFDFIIEHYNEYEK